MDYQKDTFKSVETQKDNSSMSAINSFNYNAFSGFVVNKTEKLVTALYMVTDCMEMEDAIKIRLRSLGVELLSNIHSFSIATMLETENFVAKSRTHITEILSLINIASTMGFVSEMNASILKKEFNSLVAEFAKYEEKSGTGKKEKFVSHASYTIDESTLAVPLPVYKEQELLATPFWSESPIKDKRTEGNLSFIKNYQTNKNKDKQTFSFDKGQNNKLETSRINKILEILKDTKNNGLYFSIKDISTHFVDCSEKTIQRELNDLVLSRKVKKVGEKRWSRYALF